MDASDYQKIRQLFDDYLRMYSSRDDILTTYFSEDFSGITGSGDFLVKDREEWVAITRQDFAQIKDPIRIELKDLAIQLLADTIAVATSSFTIHLPIDEHILSRKTARLVLIFRKESAGWKISHSSISIPFGMAREGEVYPMNELVDRNQYLEALIAERTIQLSEANDNLQQTNEELLSEIAERKRAEAALKESEFFFKESQRSAYIGSYKFDFIAEYWESSEVLDTIFGIDKSYNHTVQGWLDIVHPEDRDIMDLFLREEVISKRRPFSKEYRIIRKNDGETRWVYGLGEVQSDGNDDNLSLFGTIMDITERKQAEEAVTNSNRLLQTIINTVPMSVFWKDAELRYLGCNIAFAKDAGFACTNDLIGKDDYQLAWKQQAELYRDDDQSVVASGMPKLSYNELQSTPDGSQIWVRTSKVPLRNEADETTGVLGIYEDITEHKHIELDNMRLLLRQRAILDNLPMMAWLKDTESRLEMVNEPYAKACGHTVEECIGKTDLDLFPPDMARGYLDDDREVCITGRKKRVEESIATPGGTKWHLTYKTTLFDEQGQIAGTTGIAEDITDRKQAEEALKESEEQHRTILQTAMDGFWLMDTQGHILEVNGTYCRMSGYSEQELLSMCVSDLVVDEMPDGIDAGAQHLKAQGEDRFESRHRRRDGTIFDVEVSVQYRHFKGGQVVVFLRDITERKRAEIELQKKNAEIEQFIYTVSHDLRSPLVTVKTFLGYLECDMTGRDQERIDQDLQFIHGAADKMKLLLDELLEMSRIDRIETPPVRVSLMEVLVEALDVLAGVISERKVDIHLPDTDLMLLGDRPRLCQIWQNLIENAIKYSCDSTIPRIELGIQQMSGETVFFVKDNGIGIDPQYSKKIFGVFEKLNPKSDGAGLGLSMIQRIVEKCGGRIWVESEMNKTGSCFYFTLPQVVVQD